MKRNTGLQSGLCKTRLTVQGWKAAIENMKIGVHRLINREGNL